MKIKKSTISLIVLALISIILITGSPFQISDDLDKNNGHLYVKNNGQEVYAQDDGGGDDGGGDDGGGDDGGGGEEESDDSGDSEEFSEDESEESEESKSEDYESEENMDGSYVYPGENEATETPEEQQFEAAEYQAEEEDDEAFNKYLKEKSEENDKAINGYLKGQSEEELNDGWYGGTRDEDGNILPKDTDLAEWEYDNEDERGQLKDEKGFREYLQREKGIDLDTEYYKVPDEEKDKIEKEFEEQKEDKYRDITTASEDVEGFERFVEEKKGKGYKFETDYHKETPEEQKKLEKEFNDMKLKRAGTDLSPDEPIPTITKGPKIIEPKDDNRRISGDDVDDFKEFLKKEKGIDYDDDYDWTSGNEQLKLEAEFKNSKYYKQDKKDGDDGDRTIIKKYYDDDDDNDIDDFAAYNMGYRNGKFDRLSKTSYTDISPFDDKDAKTWYKIGYRAGWDSVITKSASESKIQIK